ncbi:DUF6795 domain-containing protein [Vibrio nigripulchritudo]|uniref:DUF6795 domain-containing protein n=1 Tax=Vibrio nigripulchritudo TaxID=28173 RepID=UPI0003B22EDF|nr:DUF6795 domain-containing protein [Vibrio nigripulchritudo]CCN70485.1 hypothetical protein VIBNISFn118_2160001 [Vibrio nigripulchritudo SFn118]
MKILRLFTYLIILFFSFSSYCNMLDFLKPYSYTLSPKISGVLEKSGDPYENSEIELYVEFGEINYTLYSKSDSSGHFSFDEIIQKRWTKPRGIDNNLMAIRLATHFNGQEKLLWLSYSGKYDHKSYVLDNLPSLKCDLDSDMFEYGFENEKKGGAPYRVYGICQLNGFGEKYNRKSNELD